MTAVQQRTVHHGDGISFVNRMGEGNAEAVVFLHGSGPGANAWSNWQFALPFFGERFDAIAPDFVGFGQSTHPDPAPVGASRWIGLWVRQVLQLLDELAIDKVHLVGNSLGGGVALHLLMEQPGRFDRVVLMGSGGAGFELTPELDRIWGFYEDASVGSMARIIRWFAYDQGLIANNLDEIARLRYEAAMKPEVRRSFIAMFPPPRQQHIDALTVPGAELRRIEHPALLIHGRDDGIVPLKSSQYLLRTLGGPVQMHIYGRCSHWTQLEFRESFHRLVLAFLMGELD